MERKGQASSNPRVLVLITSFKAGVVEDASPNHLRLPDAYFSGLYMSNNVDLINLYP